MFLVDLRGSDRRRERERETGRPVCVLVERFSLTTHQTHTHSRYECVQKCVYMQQLGLHLTRFCLLPLIEGDGARQKMEKRGVNTLKALIYHIIVYLLLQLPNSLNR